MPSLAIVSAVSPRTGPATPSSARRQVSVGNQVVSLGDRSTDDRERLLRALQMWHRCWRGVPPIKRKAFKNRRLQGVMMFAAADLAEREDVDN
jgi:hypothetical protein